MRRQTNRTRSNLKKKSKPIYLRVGDDVLNKDESDTTKYIINSINFDTRTALCTFKIGRNEYDYKEFDIDNLKRDI